MTSSGHHSPKQVRAAFSKAPQILVELRLAGLKFPRFVLFEDASGQLVLGKEGEVTDDQYRKAAHLIHSNRLVPCYVCLRAQPGPPDHRCEVAIDFCCGLVIAAGAHVE